MGWLAATLTLLTLAACEQRVHITATLEVRVVDPAGAPVPGTLVSFHFAKVSEGNELGHSVFDMTRTTGDDGRCSATVGYNLTPSEDVTLEAWSGNGSNRDRELITGEEAHARSADTDLVVITRSLELIACPTETPDLCGARCVDTRSDRTNCGTCGHGCSLDCLEGDCIPCSNVTGVWTTSGDCPVRSCTVTQDTCGGTIVCIDDGGMPTGPQAITVGDGTLSFSASLRTCTITVRGDSFTGTCGNALLECSVSGTR
jgi:hypothetical protein